MSPQNGGGQRQVRDSDLRIAIYSSNFFNEDGVTLTVRRIISHVKANGGSVRVVTTIPGAQKPSGDRTISNEEIVVIPAMDMPMPSYSRPEEESTPREHEAYVVGKMLGQQAMKELNAFDPNIMHITAPDGGALAAISWAYRHNVPVMATWHSNFHYYCQFYPLAALTTPLMRFWLWFFYMQIPLVLVPTSGVKLELAENLHLNPRRMEVWGRGINSSVFSPQWRSEEFRAKHGISPDTVLLCWTSRIVIEKRFDIFAEVVGRLVKEDKLDVKVLVAGKANDEFGADFLKTVQANLPCVSYIGWMGADELAIVYASSDVLLFPSGVETFGNVTLEGMASGLPCVVETQGAHLVDDGVHGFVVPRGDTEAFYQATRALCVPSGKERRKQMGAAGRKRAVEFYDNDANTRAMVDHYKSLFVKSRRMVVKLSVRWVIIDMLANLMLAVFIGGAFIIGKFVALYLFLTGQL